MNQNYYTNGLNTHENTDYYYASYEAAQNNTYYGQSNYNKANGVDMHLAYNQSHSEKENHVRILDHHLQFSLFDYNYYQSYPFYLQSTINKIPKTKNLFDSMRVPLGLVFTPFSPTVPLYPMLNQKLIRCRSCSSYLNPYVQRVDELSYICSICGRKNSIQNQNCYNDVFKLTDRPDLYYNCVEFDNQVQATEIPRPLNLIFLIDMSIAETGCLKVIFDTIKSKIQSVPGDKRASATIVCFDEFIHTYHVIESDSGLSIHHSIITDLEDTFDPWYDGMIIRFKMNNHLDFLLENLSNMLPSSNTNNSCVLSSLDYCSKIISKYGGGRITLFLAKSCSSGLGMYETRAEDNFSFKEKEGSALFSPSIDAFKTFGMNVLSKNISIDLFCFNKEHIDLANILPVVQITGGEIFIVPNIDKSSHQTKEWLKQNLALYLSRDLFINISIRLRMNDVFDIETYLGNFFVSSLHKLEIPIMNQHSTIALHLHMNNSIPKTVDKACFQISALYSNSHGVNKLRIITHSIELSDVFENIFSSMNMFCITSLLSRMAVERSIKYSLSDTKSSIVHAITDLISSYAKLTNQRLSTQLSVPFSIYQLCVTLFCLQKYDAFNIDKKIKIDKRIKKMNVLHCWSPIFTIDVLYPTLYSLTDLLPFIEMKDQYFLENYKCYSLPSSNEMISNNKIYILDCGTDIYVLLTPACSTELIQCLIGVDDYYSCPDVMVSPPILNNHISLFLHTFVSHISRHRPYLPNLLVFKQTCEIMRKKFLSNLCLDEQRTFSYNQWIKLISDKLFSVN